MYLKWRFFSVCSDGKLVRTETCCKYLPHIFVDVTIIISVYLQTHVSIMDIHTSIKRKQTNVDIGTFTLVVVMAW